MNKRIQYVRELVRIHGQEGNYTHSEHMRGMHNGLELALATMEDREPIYKGDVNEGR